MVQLPSRSLHSRLIIAFVLVLLTPTLIISVYNQWRTREVLLSQAASEQLQLAAARANAAENWIAHGTTDLLFAVQGPPLRRAANGEPGAPILAQHHFAAFLRGTAGRYNGMCLLNPAGQETICVRTIGLRPVEVPPTELRDRHTEAYFLDALSRAGIPGDGRVAIGDVDQNGSNGPVIRFSTLLEDDRGTIAGVVVLEAPAQLLVEQLLVANPLVKTSFVDARGRYVLLQEGLHPAAEASLLLDQPSQAATILGQPSGAIVDAPERPGTLQIFHRVRPTGQSALQWTVIYQQPLDGILREVHMIPLFNLAVTAGALLMALAVANLLARGIVRPVEALAAAAERVGSGDLHSNIPRGGAAEIDALSITLDRTVARLREAVETAERRRHEAETLSAATRALSSTLARDEVFERIFSELRRVVPYDSASIQAVEGDRAVIVGAYGLLQPEQIIGTSFSLSTPDSPNAAVVAARAPLVLADGPAHYAIFNAPPYRGDPIKSWLGVPMLFGTRLIGLVTLDKHEPGFYNDEHARLALDFAAHAAIAMENARLYEATQAELGERRKAEAANARLAAIIEASTDAVGMSDPSGKMIYLNSAFRTLVGISDAEDVAQFHAGDFVPATQRQALIDELFVAAMVNGTWLGEQTMLSRDGGEIPVSQLIIAHYGPDGQPEYFSTVLRDMRERRRAEEELRQSQKMEALGRLAGGLAHDFNNLLTVIMGECDLLLSELPADDPIHHSVNQIRQSGGRAAALTRQLLAFSRRQVLQAEVIDLNQVIAGTEQLLRRLIGEDISFTIDLAANLPMIRADPGQIEQVVINLAINARDAMPDGGRLLIQTRSMFVGMDPGRTHPDIGRGLYVVIAISDTGVGIDEAVKDHIFEPFFTTKPRGKGTGLGLATVHGIVRQSGGYIWFSSESGVGTTFNVHLPASAGVQVQAGVALPPVAFRPVDETVLLVEDDEQVRRLTSTILVRAGFNVLEAADGSAAISQARDFSGSIDALLTDVVLPGGMNGVQIATAVRNLRPQIRVVYMSGYTDNALVGRSLVDDEASFIQKPFTAEGLVGTLLDALARAP